MGLNNEHSFKPALVFDCETAPIVGAADFLEPVSAPSNYVKPDAIENYIKKETANQVGKCSLDPDLCRVIALGLYRNDSEWTVHLAEDEAQERLALMAFWECVGTYPYPRLVGFNVLGFDLPVLIRRSQYLDVPTRPIQMGRFKHPDVDDLMTVLNFDGAIKTHSLKFYAKRFGVDVSADPVNGKDIGQLMTEGHWAAIAKHCECDLFTTAALARRLHVLRDQPEMVL